MNEQRYVITMLVENEPGVTARVAGLFAGRGYNNPTCHLQRLNGKNEYKIDNLQDKSL